MTQLSQSAKSAVRETTDNRYLHLLGRIGLVSYGLVHLAIAYLAIQVVFGAGDAKSDKKGALQILATHGGGQLLLWVITLGLVALTIWQIGEAAVGHRRVQPAGKRTRKRIESGGEAVVFGLLAFSAGKLAAGRGADSKQGDLISWLFGLPLGRLLVGLAGIGLVAIAAVLVHHGIRATFTEDLDLSRADPKARRTAIGLGRVGYPALGVAYAIIGLLIVSMAVTFNPNAEVGFDGALTTLAAQPFGTLLLVLISVGLACFGAYCLFDARYRRS